MTGGVLPTTKYPEASTPRASKRVITSPTVQTVAPSPAGPHSR
jgi:hypothetical protein